MTDISDYLHRLNDADFIDQDMALIGYYMVLPIKIKFERIKTLLPWFVAGALIFLQIIATMILQHSDADDSFYIGVTTTILDENRIFTIDPSTGSYLKNNEC